MPSGHIDRTKPLKPLTAHSWGVLARLALEPMEAHQVNAGVIDRLWREGLIGIQDERVGFDGQGRVKRRRVVRITEAGRTALRTKGD